jgi:cell division protein FtsW (lipid II flippase)
VGARRAGTVSASSSAHGAPGHEKEERMSITNLLWLIIAVILAVWLAGLLLANVGNLIHILLIIVLALIIYNVVTGRSAV